jgi:CBS domain-containing protein
MAIPEELREIVEKVNAGKRPSVKVRRFLSWFEAERRGYKIVRSIRRSLKKAKMATVPDFEGAYIDSRISFVQEGLETKEQEGERIASSNVVAAESGLVETAEPAIPVDPTYRVGRLESANKTVISVKPDDPIERAATLMLNHDFSQLPVMLNDREVKGIISWRTIGKRCILGNLGKAVREAMEPHQEISADVSIFSAIDLIVRHDCVLVRDSTRRISGLVTTHDLSVQFGALGEPFLLLGEIENHVRSALGPLSKTELAAAIDPADGDREVEDAADLTFGEYLRLLTNPKTWAKLGLKVDQKTFTQHLEETRQIRNEVMHFDPEGIGPEDMKRLRAMATFLRQLHSLA